jgi:hypothetical protein
MSRLSSHFTVNIPPVCYKEEPVSAAGKIIAVLCKNYATHTHTHDLNTLLTYCAIKKYILKQLLIYLILIEMLETVSMHLFKVTVLGGSVSHAVNKF